MLPNAGSGHRPAGLALIAIGVYSILSYAVAGRVRGIGIRMALGARRQDVLVTIASSTGAAVGVGLFAGLPGSLGVARVLASQLWNVSAFDPVTMVAATVVAVCTGGAASAIPAWRAIRIDPLRAMRHE